MSIIGTLAAKNLAAPLLKIGSELIDNLFETEEEKAAARAKLMEQEQKGNLEHLKTSLSVMLAEAQSKDKWTSRARPTFLYVVYLILLLCVVGAIIGIWWPDQVMQAAANLQALFNALPEQIIWLFGTVMLGYTGGRTFEKIKGAAK